MVKQVVRIGAGSLWLTSQPHSGLRRRRARLPVIAGDTGADDILPDVRTASGPRDNVVEGKRSGLLAAVLAGELVPVKD